MIVVTGGAGFIGSALIWRLNSLGLGDILVVDNLGSSQKWRNLVKLRYLDYMHKDKFMERVRGNALGARIDGIVHLGACSSTTESDSDFLMENNFHYSRDLCRYALENDIRFINASSAATYGGGECGFTAEASEIGKLRPLNMYGYSKHLMDLWLKRENLLDEVVSLKFFNVYGPNEYHKGSMQSVAAKLYNEIADEGKATLFASTRPEIEDGEQKRDFVYIKDVADIIAWLMLDRADINGIRNVGSGRARSFNDLAKTMFRVMKRPENIVYTPTPEAIAANYQNFTEADMEWLKTENYPQKMADLENGLQDYIEGYLAQKDRYL